MTDEAIASWFSAQEIQPDSLKAHTNLGVALAKQGRVDEAQKHFEKAMEINPYIANIHVNMGKLFIKKEMFEEAEKHFKEALGLTPNIAYLLAKIYLGTGRFEDALKYLKKAIRIEPDQIEVMNNLAWILATYKKESVRNPDEAIRLAERACELSDYGSPDLVDTLAVAYAAGGRFQEAVDMAEMASELISSLGLRGGLEVEVQRHLLMFKKGQPYVEGQL
jgi:tetratricopeptide (TPR) repeat protein